MDNILICTIKSWNFKEASKLKDRFNQKYNIIIVTDNNCLSDIVSKTRPLYIFFPHWSYIIPEEIYTKYKCVVFHMTDLPYGRGGSPLQNLIVQGIENTKISAINVEKKIHSGAIYMKENLNLNGTAEEILMRASKIIFNKMIPYILLNNPEAVIQKGKITTFKRRCEKDGELKPGMDLSNIYDYIRMLDGEGYPNAYIKFGRYRLEFSRAGLKNGSILADVKIIEEEYDGQDNGSSSTS